MNALVASVIRTLVPVAVGQVASWLLLAHVVLPAPDLNGLSAFIGGLLTAIYYVAVRVLEQQWPTFGILLGLPSSPDTYSKSAAAAVTDATPETPTVNPAHTFNILAPVADTSIPAPVEAPATPAASFADMQARIDAAINGTPAPDALVPVIPTSVIPTAPAVAPAMPAQ